MIQASRRLSLVILAAMLFLACDRVQDSLTSPPGQASTPLPQTESKYGKQTLDIDSALAWRNTFGDLIGKPMEAARERFGEPDGGEGEDTLNWKASQKTNDRKVDVVLESDKKAATIIAVKVYARPEESVDPIEVIRRATLFEFESGTYQDTATSYFIAKTKDDRNSFQFDLKDGTVSFRRMLFVDPKYLESRPK